MYSDYAPLNIVERRQAFFLSPFKLYKLTLTPQLYPTSLTSTPPHIPSPPHLSIFAYAITTRMKTFNILLALTFLTGAIAAPFGSETLDLVQEVCSKTLRIPTEYG